MDPGATGDARRWACDNGQMDDTRQAELDILFVGGAAPRHDKPIHLAPYNPEWPAWYEREATRIRAALGDRVRVLERAGSTSVPGLSAKPVIDIALAVADSGGCPMEPDARLSNRSEIGHHECPGQFRLEQSGGITDACSAATDRPTRRSM
jgi:hypothetical protein